MIEQEKLDVRTITMGISLLDCAADSVDEVCENIYNKITTYAKDLVSTGRAIEREFRHPDRQQAHHCHPIPCRRKLLQELRGFCQDRTRTRPRGQEGRRRPDRRLLRARVQVHDPG